MLNVLVPFYRGAVVFRKSNTLKHFKKSSRPLLSRSGCISKHARKVVISIRCSRPLLSRSGCIFNNCCDNERVCTWFSSPFIEERLYFNCLRNDDRFLCVLVPFYRGAVVFNIGANDMKNKLSVLVPFYRGAVVFKKS